MATKWDKIFQGEQKMKKQIDSSLERLIKHENLSLSSSSQQEEEDWVRKLYGPELCGFVVEALRHPRIRLEILECLKMPENVIFHPSLCTTNPQKLTRLIYLTLTSGMHTRSHFLALIDYQLKQRSLSLSLSLQQEDHPVNKVVWDVVVVGAGIHASTFVNSFRNERPGSLVLLIEKEAEPSGHFNVGGRYFRINSTLNKPDYGPAFESKGKYNHPHVCGPVQMTDLTGSRWPSAEKIGQLGKIALHSSGSFVLFNEEVTGISSSSDSGHKVTTKSGKVFECINAVIATGLGIPKLPCRKDEKSLNLIQEELRITASSPLLSNKNRIMTVDQALRRVDSLDPLGEWRQLSKNKLKYPIIVVGSGNSALTFLEFIHSLAPDAAYVNERVQRGDLPAILCIGGSNPISSPLEYQKSSRPRYVDITSPMKSGKITFQPGYLVKVEEGEGGVLVASYRTKDNEIHKVETNRIVLGTGFLYSYKYLLPSADEEKEKEKEKKEDDEEVMEVVRGFPFDAKKEIPMGKKMKNERIFLTGAAAGHDIVDKDYNINGGVKIKEVGQVEALAFTSVLTEAFAKHIAETTPATTSCCPSITQPLLSLPSSSSSHQTAIKISEPEMVYRNFVVKTIDMDAEEAARLQLSLFFQNFELNERESIKFSFGFREGSIYVRSKEVEEEGIKRLGEKLGDFPSVLMILVGLLWDGVQELVVDVVNIKGGKRVMSHLVFCE